MVRILLIDDDEVFLRALPAALKSSAPMMTIDTAATAEHALRLIQDVDFDVIVSDWKMPGLNGMHLYEQLLGTDPKSAGRMLFMTGDVINEGFQEFLRKNARACLSKPFAIEEFRAAVANVIIK